MSSPHPSLSMPFARRAELAAHPLTAYLYRLMDVKSSNLCLSADVTSARDLLALADRVGPSIVVLKTHYDIISGWDYNPQTGTGAQLAALARKHGFLLFEDRKYADIGKTAQQQYTAGTARVIEWAHLVTVNMDAGVAAVTALAEAAARWHERINYEVKTSVTVGTPVLDGYDDSSSSNGSHRNDLPWDTAHDGSMNYRDHDGRKASIVSITTAVTQHFEPAGSPRLHPPASTPGGDSGLDAEGGGQDGQGGGGGSGRGSSGDNDNAQSSSGGGGGNTSAAPRSGDNNGSSGGGRHNDGLISYDVYPGIEEAPLERGILLLAQMSSKGNLMTEAYTQACVEAARAHKNFVSGFIAQQSLNTQPDDAFVHLTPGCRLPTPEEEQDIAAGSGAIAGDGMGQQYNSPAKLVGTCGTDIIIVGRGIITAADPPSEAERYRRRAWKAYLSRLA